MALLPRGCLVLMPLLLLAAVIAAAAAGTEWVNEGHHRGHRSHRTPAAAPAVPPSTQGLYPPHGPAPGATSPQGAEAPAPAPEAGDHSDGAAAVPVSWPVALLAAAGVAAVMMV
ncbi:LOW QUALITY PROTEIN: hypothetical protein GQ55_3G251200 [Panicum hallii var. hallii]|uniref:Uncharacterized protein n=1 Tax=Panicum hallii var. hallii TaxID=1504633 RepID=A0A2T7ED69_9POAL|nr:LOW QUALITY PROTEIN: hypothetical protein GQ55_3G251200 [Panicum hallii var. hallii]